MDESPVKIVLFGSSFFMSFNDCHYLSLSYDSAKALVIKISSLNSFIP